MIHHSTWISRAMLVTYSPLASANIEAFTADGLSYSVFPPGSEAGNSDGPVYGILQSQESMACPKGQCKFYIQDIILIRKTLTVYQM